jgi:molybdenum cofactor biosynthesis enzyme MoaA
MLELGDTAITVGAAISNDVKRSQSVSKKVDNSPWPEQKKHDPATGWRLSDSFLKYKNLFTKVRLFLFLTLKGRSLENPYYAHYQITRRCNFRCPSCQVWRDESYANGLSIDEMKVAARNLRAIGVKSVAITGGEATLRKDIVEVVKTFSAAGLLIRFHTNAFILTEGLVERLFRAGVADIYISLDSLDPDVFNTINGMTRQGTFERVLKNIKHTADMSARFGANLFLTAVLRKDNIAEVASLHEFAKSINSLIAFYGIEVAPEGDPLNIRAQDQSLKPTKTDSDLIAETFDSIINLKNSKKNNIFMSTKLMKNFRDFFADPDLGMMWNCNAGKLYLELLPEGTFSVCNATPPIPGYDYRNITELYNRPDREDIFNKYRTTCGGCICTRQLEDVSGSPKDLFDKVRVYLSSVFK